MTKPVIILFIYLISAPVLNSEPLVQISQGILQGKIEKSRSGRNYSAFLGIPYGKPPVGDLRFRNPLPAGKWKGIRQAKYFGSECLHTFLGITTFGKEDCLFLNVYSPFLEFQENMKLNTSKDTLLPVMVWIYGGIFFFGGSNNYEGNYIMDKDVLLVTMNYRQGILGFLSTGDFQAPGNFGLKDQVLALKWVQKNIHAFGGDRNRVTLFGLSSGSVCVHLHTLSKASDGLFHQYIMQSGTALSGWAYRDSSKIFESVKKIAKFVSCPTENTKKLMHCLRNTDAQRLLFFSNIVGLFVRIAEIAWVPTNEPENEDAFLSTNPENLMHQMKDLPSISGVTENEGLFFTNAFYSIHPLYNLIRKYMKKLFIDDAIYMRNTKKSFPTNVHQFYINNSNQKNLDTYTTILTDGLFIYPEMKMLDEITPRMKNPIYFYNFGYRGEVPTFSTGLSKMNFGVGHASDLVFVFPFTYFLISINDAKFANNDRNISKLIIDLWTSFAANGVPTSAYLDPPNLWKPYNSKNNPHLQIGDKNDNMKPTVTLSNNFLTKRMDFWRKNFPH